ncbi:uncharacterized protein DUF3164 [Mucilaginibacter gracilis]|uniref:Uncharacterized protein DUF3164 n=1 Tax=Mucilaginibacter gracilis TaxID=423350 RepID=A0A495J3P1_9SPHI|nr:DUF3164 family protein [Mucilaginibacter gracilis]RKR83222.1 uncharacterized protein DUF3164 [Mucilaginibacter gracilis]
MNINVDHLTTEQLEAILKDRHEKNVAAANAKRAAYEQLKEDTIVELSLEAIALGATLELFKSKVFNSLGTLYELLQEYSKRHSDGKGNFTIESRDAMYKIEFSRQTLGHFDERADQAERHMIDFLNSQFSGDEKTKKFIMQILERSKDKLDVKQIQKLYAMENDYQDSNWLEGIKLFKEAWTPSETKDYTRFWVKENGAWKAINLNFSSIVVALSTCVK